MSANTLKESTLRRLMEMAGTLDYADEVILENKKTSGKVIKENKESCAPSKKVTEKKEKGDDDKKDEKDSEKNLMLDEAGEVEIDDEPEEEMEPAPTGDSDLTDVPNVPPGADAGGVVEDDLQSFAAGLVDLLSQHFNRQVTMQIDGSEVSPQVESEESFEPAGEEVSDLPPEPASELPPEEPKLESKKKTAAQLVYETIVSKLLKQSGVDAEQAKKNGTKVDLKFVPKKK